MYTICRKILTFIFSFLYSNIDKSKQDNLNNIENIEQYFEKKYVKARFSLFKILEILFEFHEKNNLRPYA